MNDNITDIKAPELPESIIDATVITWHKKEGDYVKCNDILVDIETDKIILEIPSPAEGIVKSIIKKKGSKVLSKEVLGKILNIKKEFNEKVKNFNKQNFVKKDSVINFDNIQKNFLSPSLRRLSKINTSECSNIKPIKPINKKIYKDTNDFQEKMVYQKTNSLISNLKDSPNKKEIYNRINTRIPMSHIRKKISERLLASQKNMAMLTTFNEVNMKPIMKFRKKYNKAFKKKYGIKLGFMPFFVKSVIDALKKFPEINASIDNNDIIRYNYFDVSIAVSTNKGLITPVLKNADLMNISEIEKKIQEFSIKGNTGKLTIDELIGGNITISNGGVFGSLMSTPIINPPQSTILGMHIIKKRPMVIDEEIKILPMMYLALSYDHRLIDGKEAVGFLIRIKDVLEDFSRVLLDI